MTPKLFISRKNRNRYQNVDECPTFLTHSCAEFKPYQAINSLKLPIVYLMIYWIIIISMWQYFKSLAKVVTFIIVLINMLICAFVIPLRNLKFMNFHRETENIDGYRWRKFTKFIENINKMIASTPLIYQLYYYNEEVSCDYDKSYFIRHHYQEIFDKFIHLNMSDNDWINEKIFISNDNIQMIIIPIRLKFEMDFKIKNKYEIWKEKCCEKMDEIKENKLLRQWDGIFLEEKHLNFDVFRSTFPGIYDGETRWLCYWKRDKRSKIFKCCSKYLPIYFLLNLLFGSMGLTLFTHYKYNYFAICLLSCSSFIVYDEILIHKKLFDIDRSKRLLILDILQNECQDDDQIEYEPISEKILDLVIGYVNDALIPNRIHYDSASKYYSTTYHSQND